VGAATQQIVFGHRDFEYLLPGSIKATFLWAPYGTNLTAHFKAWWESLCMCPRSTALREQGHGAEQRKIMSGGRVRLRRTHLCLARAFGTCST